MIKVIDIIVNFLGNVGRMLTADLIAAIGVGLVALVIIISAIVAHHSVETKTNRKVKQINNYLLNNPFINDENIVEFNRIMKHRMPRAMRYQWQRYIVNRKDKPSVYLSEENCISKPFRTSAFSQVLKQFKYIVGFILLAVFAFSMGANMVIDPTPTNMFEIVLRSSIVPVALLVLYVVFLGLMNARRNAILNDLFYNFDSMQHSLDRAVATFPAFVDYEILFTKKEIAAGIPVLQEYLQQRAQYEQEQLERARLSQVEHEKYDFSKLGGKGTMIMERAMKECEFYLGNRKTLLADIDSLQTQKDLLSKNFDEKNRANQRKLRDIKENIERLREKLNTTTNKIVGNDIIKQQADEVKKQQLVEKEMEDENNRYLDECKKLDTQIENKKAEIENNRQTVENTLINDFKDYSDKIYEELKNIAESQLAEKISALENEKNRLENEIEDRDQYIIKKDAMYEVKSREADELVSLRAYVDELKKDIIVKDHEIIGAKREVESRKLEIASLEKEVDRLYKEKYHEVYRYFDDDGNEFFYDDDNKPYFYGPDGKIQYYQDLSKISNAKRKPFNDNSGDGEPVKVEIVEEEKPQVVEEVVEEPKEESVQEQTQDELPSIEELNKIAEEPDYNFAKIDNIVFESDKNDLSQANENGLSNDELKMLLEEDDEKLHDVIEEAKEEVAVQEQPAEEVKEEPKEEKPEVDLTEEQLSDLDKEIENQNKILEEQYKNLQAQISEAEKVASDLDEPKEEPAKKPASKPKKAPAKKPVEKKPAPAKKPAEKPKTKKPRDTKKYVFNVKKVDTANGTGNFDLSGFDNIKNKKSGK